MNVLVCFCLCALWGGLLCGAVVRNSSWCSEGSVARGAVVLEMCRGVGLGLRAAGWAAETLCSSTRWVLLLAKAKSSHSCGMRRCLGGRHSVHFECSSLQKCVQLQGEIRGSDM